MRGYIGPLLLVAAIASGAALIYACTSETPPPTGGDNVVDDTKPTATPTQPLPPPPDGGATPDGYGYDGRSYEKPDGYNPLGVCNTCACSSAGTPPTYCFGGGTGQTTFDGKCADAATSAQPQLGCNAIPAACAATPTCSCILTALGKYPCYLVCGTGGGIASDLSVYCPNP
jgi:hypothetical protein